MHVKTVARFFITFIISNLLHMPLAIANVNIITAVELAKTAQHRTYVGVIPYYQVNNKIYVLLGRETKDSRKVDAGLYTDFGSSVKINDSTILKNAVNVLNKDTMGKLKISEQDLIKSGKVIYKQIQPDHDVYYIFYKVSQQQFLKINKFKVQHARLKASSVANANLGKDQFIWFNFEDLLKNSTADEFEAQNKLDVYTIDGKQITAHLRKYFIVDCLQSSELPSLIK